jgi:hypothetical protein
MVNAGHQQSEAAKLALVIKGMLYISVVHLLSSHLCDTSSTAGSYSRVAIDTDIR